ncbi:MAG: alpha-xylosidase [Marinilabiliaceae bacterium]|nr:alpha-xylosidase [Marinilabiliaceae bacterium]
MISTNFQLFDFLDFDKSLDGSERLWRACRPNSITIEEGDAIIQIPFQKQICSSDIVPDREEPAKVFEMRIRAYGSKTLRVVISPNKAVFEDSPMLELRSDLKQSKLSVQKNENEWLVIDEKGVTRAKFNFTPIEIDHWSDLLPVPEETINVTFYPDGDKAVKISAYDQFFPARHDAFALATVEKDGGFNRSTMSFHCNPDEVFVGSGERFTKMDLSGQTFYLKNQDGQGVNNRRTYKNIPFYISSAMYGAFMHTSAYGKMSFADHSSRSVQLMVETPELDLFLFGGDTVEEILYEYRSITGFPTIPPLWSYGVWMSRMTYFSADEVNEICDRMRTEDYPCDVIHLDTGWFRTDWLCEWMFNPERFPDPPKFIADLKDKGYRVSLWQMPYIASKAAQHDEAKENKYMAPLHESRQQGGSNFSALDYAGTIDFTYSKAVEWYKQLLKNLLNMGVVCIKTDFGEDIHMEADYHSMKPELLNNLYALLYQKAAYEVTKEVTGEGIVWARAGWAGCQRYPLHWGGDSACSWDGMAGSLKGGLHIGLSGFAYWSHDVPGFHGVPNFMNSVIPDDLYVRWTQFGVFSSHIRYHGTSKREPYEYPNISDVVRKWWKLRYLIIPYILQQSKKASQSGYPLLRALVFHHPKDKMCWHISDQYYFGDDFMVAPVINSENKRDVYLPEGSWINLFDGSEAEGSKWLYDYETAIDEMPVWVKKDAIIPIYPDHVNCTNDMDMNKVVNLKIDCGFKSIWEYLNH